MSDTTKLGPWVRRLLLEHLVSERNLARNTQRSYRDTLALLIPFIAGKVHKPIDQLDLDPNGADRLGPSHSNEPRRLRSPTSTSLRWMHCSRHPNVAPRKGVATTRSYCSCTIPEPAPMKQHTSASAIFI